MPVRLLAAVFEVPEPFPVAHFWGALLSRDVVDGPGGALLCGEGAQLGLAFVPQRTEKVELNRMHLHLTSASHADQEHTVETALRLGAHHLDVGQLADENHVVLADPGVNEFCVIEPGNSFLAGCGFVGELACDGSRDVGLFWSEALSWPLVWDQDQETAIQLETRWHQASSWGGPSASPRTTPDRQRFDLVPDQTDYEIEVERLVNLGARLLRRDEPGVTALADPDGFEFQLLRSRRLESRAAQKSYGQPHQEPGGYRAERDDAPTIQRPDRARLVPCCDGCRRPPTQQPSCRRRSQPASPKEAPGRRRPSIHASIVSARRPGRRHSRDSAAPSRRTPGGASRRRHLSGVHDRVGVGVRVLAQA